MIKKEKKRKYLLHSIALFVYINNLNIKKEKSNKFKIQMNMNLNIAKFLIEKNHLK